MDGPYTERAYRVDSWAMDAAFDQMVINVLRRLCFLPLRKHSWEAAEEVRQRYRKPSVPRADDNVGE